MEFRCSWLIDDEGLAAHVLNSMEIGLKAGALTTTILSYIYVPRLKIF